jgi:hypothetical protein
MYSGQPTKPGRSNPANAVALDALRFAAPNAVIAPEHLALLTFRYWGIPGVQLTVSFLDDAESDLQERILSHMNAWQQYYNATFTLAVADGDVRIARAADRYWSYLGTDINMIDHDQAPPPSLPCLTTDSTMFTTVFGPSAGYPSST